MEIEKLTRDHPLIKELVGSYRDEWQHRSGQRDKEKRRYFYMSDVSKCDREIYYCFLHPEHKRTIADKTLIFFRHGNLYHEEAQSRLKKVGLVDNSRDLEYGLEDWEIEATGRLDNFITENGGLAIAELKSKNPYGFNVEEPVEAEMDQLQWYMSSAKKSKNLKKRNILDYGYILYLERGEISDFPILGWKISYDPERVEIIRERFTKLGKVIADKKIPKRPYERDSIKCQYCRFKEYCWRGVPVAAVPEFLPDDSIATPEQEIVESAEKRYVELKKEISEREKELKDIYAIIMRYFKSTGIEETEKLKHIFSKSTSLDKEYLLSKLKTEWHLIATPQAKLIQKAIKDGVVDPEVFERAKKVEFRDSIRIKGGINNADKRAI